MYRIPVGDTFESIVDSLQDNLDGFFTVVGDIISSSIDGVEGLLNILPSLGVIALIVALMYFLTRKVSTSVFALLGLLLIVNMNLWEDTMNTLSLVLVAAVICFIIGIPVGIWSAKSDKVERVIKPILDFMQTLPAFVYLIPAVIFFRLGSVPGVVATVIFATPPAVRLTNLGIRQVPKEVVEAAQSFGSTSKQMLIKVQLPMALPTILAGINQTIMLALSMVVISAMIGAGGLGEKVLTGVTQLRIGMGFEAGIAVVILAMILDSLTQSVGRKK